MWKVNIKQDCRKLVSAVGMYEVNVWNENTFIVREKNVRNKYRGKKIRNKYLGNNVILYASSS